MTELENIKKQLFHSAITNHWCDVVDIYRKNPQVHAEVSNTGNGTALHMAVSNGREIEVEDLVDAVRRCHDREHAKNALTSVNERGNTPLHLAARLGVTTICRCIAKEDHGLVACRNLDGETPLFLAVLHGNKDAFPYLYDICRNQPENYSFCRRNDGETILHCAISGEYFDLSYQIIQLFPKLAHCLNEQGLSPLHILASKPSAFKSGTRMTRFERLIYKCTYVDMWHTTLPSQLRMHEELARRRSAISPPNYQTCSNFVWIVRKIVFGSGNDNPGQQQDEEDPSRQGLHNNPQYLEMLERIETEEYDASPHHFPEIYITCYERVKFLRRAILNTFGIFGLREIQKTKTRKQKHAWSKRVLRGLLKITSLHAYEDDGRNPHPELSLKDKGTTPYAFTESGEVTISDSWLTSPPKLTEPSFPGYFGSYAHGEFSPTGEMRKQIPLLIAARNGIVKMVDAILEHFPVAINDMDSKKKNIVLLAVENRQRLVYNYLLETNMMKDTIFCKTDMDGNSALHIAAILRVPEEQLLDQDAALQLQQEIKWFEYVKNTMPVGTNVRINRRNETPEKLFIQTHRDLVEGASVWLNHVSQSCSLVAALVATVAYATSASIPGGYKQEKGAPAALQDEPAFYVFAIASLLALCFSVTSVVIFLAILMSGFHIKDFHTSLPRKLLMGLSALCISIIAMIVSFCASHFFILRDKLGHMAFGLYGAVAFIPVIMTCLLISRFPHAVDLMLATFTNLLLVKPPVSEHSDEMILPS